VGRDFLEKRINGVTKKGRKRNTKVGRMAATKGADVGVGRDRAQWVLAGERILRAFACGWLSYLS
jgi:hypothetical protein